MGGINCYSCIDMERSGLLLSRQVTKPERSRMCGLTHLLNIDTKPLFICTNAPSSSIKKKDEKSQGVLSRNYRSIQHVLTHLRAQLDASISWAGGIIEVTEPVRKSFMIYK